ncbi:hypothetical protein [Amycolatopsis sp. RTGN1]|nr:hypothetical protein [Amycolatopsis sp. RTGN1]
MILTGLSRRDRIEIAPELFEDRLVVISQMARHSCIDLQVS